MNRLSTGKLATDGVEIFEGDYIEAKTLGKYPFYIGGKVKFDLENNVWVNLDFLDKEVPHTIRILTEK